ncbi:hypothetical protein CHS0354_029792 [Potamilus streckersoni]|uniref:Uncharacterized protein n=1 Tax=Potamilus streckersoni TaxID=2493646 RepID=A0AAE0THY8_9BIVA|nr:hypothetical protein CHS0354_029792 [Potamilus streckersoni]
MKEEDALIGNPDSEMTSVKVEVPEPEENPDDEDDEAAAEYRNDGYIELVLKVMARMCDGQNHSLQNYLREQPDNVKSFNIIGEVTRFLNVIYSNITGKNIELVIQLFESMNEFTAGNQENRVVIYDNKIIDYINFILRAGDIANSPTEKILALRESISNLVISLIEENGPLATQVALEVKDTLDKKSVFQLMTECYEMHQTDKKKLEELKSISIIGLGQEDQSSTKLVSEAGKNIFTGVMKKKKDELSDVYMNVGFRLYLILARMVDIDPKFLDNLKLTPLQQKAYNFYKKNSMSVEVVKDNELQKVNFRVKNKQVLREEVKEMLKWNVDRSSPSNKIRDLMAWTKDIMKDIAYQRGILSNFIAIILTKGWLVWNYLVVILSFAINIMMLVTWSAKASLDDHHPKQANTTAVPPDVEDPIPVITKLTPEQYTIALYTLGGLHNFFSLLVFISYFLGNHPGLPNPKTLLESIRSFCSRGKKDDDTEDESRKKPHQSKLDAKFFSFTTFYYMAFLALSIGGTFSHGYFFAFHLLNIVNNNQLLSGVIKAVTQNGRSLLWVAVLGLVVFYLYGIVGFALMRSMFNPDEYLYCDSLWQCTITVIRYGLIGDLFEVMKSHPSEKTFHKFGFVVLYHISFFIFITTIGLNIIFGIIVDTFSELRDLKWTSESDMRDTCFICSRNSYDFEHHGKGFEHHVRFEHNMWSYVFFFIHLNGTKVNDYTAMEMYVFKLLKKENFDFFPLDRALSLAAMGKDSTETKIDDLLFQVTSIVEKQKREELERKRREERMRQKVWEQKYRLGSFRRKARLPFPTDQDSLLPSGTPQYDGPDQHTHASQSGLILPPSTDMPFYPLQPPPRSPLQSVPSSFQAGRRPSDSMSRRPSEVGLPPPSQAGPLRGPSRHDKFRRRRSVSPIDPREMLFRRGSPSRLEDEEPLLSTSSPRYEERIQSPPYFGLESDVLEISPVPMSRRASYEAPRSPRYPESLSTSPRGAASFFADSDPMPYLRQYTQQLSEHRASLSSESRSQIPTHPPSMPGRISRDYEPSGHDRYPGVDPDSDAFSDDQQESHL